MREKETGADVKAGADAAAEMNAAIEEDVVNATTETETAIKMNAETGADAATETIIEIREIEPEKAAKAEVRTAGQEIMAAVSLRISEETAAVMTGENKAAAVVMQLCA